MRIVALVPAGTEILRTTIWLLLLVVLGQGRLPATDAAPAAATGNVGLVIALGDGQVDEYCFSVPADGATGLELLQRTGLALRLDYVSLGAEICAIGGVGCLDPNAPCFCQCQGTPCLFWHYAQWRGTGWAAANLGANSDIVHPGGIEGWGWGANPPPPSGQARCALAAPAAPTPPPAPSARPLPPPPTPLRPPPTPPVRSPAPRPPAPAPTAAPPAPSPPLRPLAPTSTAAPPVATRVRGSALTETPVRAPPLPTSPRLTTSPAAAPAPLAPSPPLATAPAAGTAAAGPAGLLTPAAPAAPPAAPPPAVPTPPAGAPPAPALESPPAPTTTPAPTSPAPAGPGPPAGYWWFGLLAGGLLALVAWARLARRGA